MKIVEHLIFDACWKESSTHKAAIVRDDWGSEEIVRFFHWVSFCRATISDDDLRRHVNDVRQFHRSIDVMLMVLLLLCTFVTNNVSQQLTIYFAHITHIRNWRQRYAKHRQSFVVAIFSLPHSRSVSCLTRFSLHASCASRARTANIC